MMKEENLSFGEAVGKLIGEEYITYQKEIQSYRKEEKGPLVLPDKAQNFKRVFWYLASCRGIEPEIISHFMNLRMIYQEAKYGNCVFVGYDSHGTAKYCSMRAARENNNFKMDVINSDKSYPWAHEGKSDLLIVNESPVDMMSHATIAKMVSGKDWRDDHRLSLGCLWNGALERYLDSHSQIKRIMIAVDNDYLARNKDGILKNWGQLTAEKWRKEYMERGYLCTVNVPHLKDFNKDLIEMRKGHSVEDLDHQRMMELEQEFEKDTVSELETEDDWEV